MKQIRKKLNSNAGASMILALGLLLVCVIVSSIIVPAAASGLSRNKNRTAQQREYLAVSSAAELIAEELKAAGTYIGIEEKHVPGCWDYKPAEGSPDNVESFTVTSSGKEYAGYRLDAPVVSGAEMSFLLVKSVYNGTETDENPFCASSTSEIKEANPSQLGGKLKVLLAYACKSVISNNSTYTNMFEISLTGETSDTNSNATTDRIPKVKCEFSMDTDYNIEIKIYSESGADGYSVVILMEADEIHKKDASNSGETTITNCTHKVLNIFPDDNNGDGYADTSIIDYEFQKTNDCSTTEITWHEPVITKGGQ